jgi:hypothetical protein
MRSKGDWSEVETTTRVLKKLDHLAAALTHQPDYRYIGFGVSRHHADQGALAHARPAEYSHPLPSAYGQQGIENSNAGAQWGLNGNAVEGRNYGWVQGKGQGDNRRPASIDGLAHRIQHSAHQSISYLDLGPDAEAYYCVSKANALGALNRHRQHSRTAEPDDLSQMRMPKLVLDLAALAHRTQRT